MSHPHADHIGSMAAVLEAVEVEQVLLPDFDKAPYPTTKLFERVMEAIEASGAQVTTARAGQSYPIGNGTLSVLADGVDTDNYNDLSQVLYFEAGELTVLLSGDGEKPVEQAALLAHRVGLGIAAQQSTLVVQQKGTVFHSAVASAEEDGGTNIDAQFFCQGSHMDEGRAVFCLGLGHHVWNACPIITQVERFREAHQFGTSGRGLTEILLCFPQVGLSVQKRGDHLYQRDGVRGRRAVHSNIHSFCWPPPNSRGKPIDGETA